MQHHQVARLKQTHLQEQADLLWAELAGAMDSRADRLAIPVRKLCKHDGHVVRSADGDDVDRRRRCRCTGACDTVLPGFYPSGLPASTL